MAKPPEICNASRFNVIRVDCDAHFFGKLQVSAGHVMAWSGKLAMNFDEIALWNAVAIGEQQIIAVRGENGSVENHRFPEAAVLMPDVNNSHLRARPYVF